MYRDRDFDLQAKLPPNADVLIQDLELKKLFDAMALGDKFLFDVAKVGVLSSLKEPEAITYRQRVLNDSLEHSAVVREIYQIAVKAIEAESKEYLGIFMSKSPDSLLWRSVRVLEKFVDSLRRLRYLADEHGEKFQSDGFVQFFQMLTKELDDEYFRIIQEHLEKLKFENGVLISAQLGKGNRGINYVLRKSLGEKRSWVRRVLPKRRSPYSFELDDHDQNGPEFLSELRGRGINLAANALAQSTDHILSFFTMLKAELGFYIGCINLREYLVRKGEPTCTPAVLPSGGLHLSAQGLYEVCLSLGLENRVVGNELNANGRNIMIITGANQGGKSTFLRSLGLAFLMMQCGMFVAAEQFSASVCSGAFTHFKREEDVTMKSGKLDEELKRMSEIADQIKPNCILLCNESFSSTNEREGSDIARQIVRALLDSRIRVFFVTFLFDFAQGFHEQKVSNALFLRAERQIDGKRTFKIVEGQPLPTGYGGDLYKRIFGSREEQAALVLRPGSTM